MQQVCCNRLLLQRFPSTDNVQQTAPSSFNRLLFRRAPPDQAKGLCGFSVRHAYGLGCVGSLVAVNPKQGPRLQGGAAPCQGGDPLAPHPVSSAWTVDVRANAREWGSVPSSALAGPSSTANQWKLLMPCNPSRVLCADRRCLCATSAFRNPRARVDATRTHSS